MKRQHYFFKLIPLRRTFPADIRPDEAALMEKPGAAGCLPKARCSFPERHSAWESWKLSMKPRLAASANEIHL
jgi:hypothetical protein